MDNQNDNIKKLVREAVREELQTIFNPPKPKDKPKTDWSAAIALALVVGMAAILYFNR